MNHLTLKEKFVLLFSIGFSLGLIIETGIYAFIDSPEAIIEARSYFFITMIVSGLFGGTCFGWTILYDIEHWGLLKSTVSHYAISLGSFLVIDVILKWFPSDIIIYVFIFFTIAYFIIWLVMYIKWKIEVRKLNTDLKNIENFLDEKKSDE